MLNGGNYAFFLQRNLGTDKRVSHLRQINLLLKVKFGDEFLFSSQGTYSDNLLARTSIRRYFRRKII